MPETSTAVAQENMCPQYHSREQKDPHVHREKNSTSVLPPNNNARKKITSLLFCACFILATLLLVKYVDFDLVLQEHFYNRTTHQWWITPEMHANLSCFFYKGVKIIAGILGVLAFLGVLAGFLNIGIKKFRKPLLLLMLSIFLVPGIVAGSKQITNIYTPAQLRLYDGTKTYRPVLSKWPPRAASEKRGLGFPAGHATTGFAFMCLFFCFCKRKFRYLGLGLGISLGWILGIYQTFRGEHFLSHTIVSMFLAWMVIILIDIVINRYLPD